MFVHVTPSGYDGQYEDIMNIFAGDQSYSSTVLARVSFWASSYTCQSQLLLVSLVVNCQDIKGQAQFIYVYFFIHFIERCLLLQSYPVNLPIHSSLDSPANLVFIRLLINLLAYYLSIGKIIILTYPPITLTTSLVPVDFPTCLFTFNLPTYLLLNLHST